MNGKHTLNHNGLRDRGGAVDLVWSGVSYAPHCRYCVCPDCGEKLHKEAGEHYCPCCDDFKSRQSAMCRG